MCLDPGLRKKGSKVTKGLKVTYPSASNPFTLGQSLRVGATGVTSPLYQCNHFTLAAKHLSGQNPVVLFEDAQAGMHRRDAQT